jgi:hypothetical protein
MSIDLILQNNPNLLPREEVRIEHVTATPYPDGRRVHVEVAITPFRERPNLEMLIVTRAGQTAASTSAVAVMNTKVGFNLHLRGASDPDGEYTVRVLLYYEDPNAPQDTHESALSIQPSPPENNPR